jgi:Amt family ammonium transporter
VTSRPHFRIRTFSIAAAFAGWAFASFAQEPAPAAPAEAAATSTAEAAPPQAAAASPAEAASAAAPALPAYFTATNDPAKPTWPDPAGGASGVWATPAGDGKGDIPADMTPAALYDRIAHNLYSINYVWLLVTGFLVMFMQAGFMLVETGLCRAKNASHTSAMNFLIYPLGCIAFWAYGFAIGWGNWWNGPVPPGWYPSLGPGLSVLNEGWGLGGNGSGLFTYGLIGLKGFFLTGSVNDVAVMALFFFMMVFMDTTATIPTGSMAERWAWKNFILYGLWVALPYCLYANWVWGGGFLAQAGLNWGLGHGAVDFAGSGVVHSMGGVLALAGALVIGPRIGKYKDGKPQPMPGHNIPIVVLGTFILAFGWFGFNPGSTLSGTDLRISFVVVNTLLAGVAAALGSAIALSIKGLKHDPSMLCNGLLAGLVAITAPCAFVSPWAAVAIGGIAGFVVVYSVLFWEKAGVDDVVGAISVHGVGGLWGVISLGLFANGEYGAGWNGVVRDEMVAKYGFDGVRGLFYGDASQFGAQLLSAFVVAVFGFVTGYAWFKLSNLITPIRVPAEVEVEGLDVPEVGAPGYPDFSMKTL